MVCLWLVFWLQCFAIYLKTISLNSCFFPQSVQINKSNQSKIFKLLTLATFLTNDNVIKYYSTAIISRSLTGQVKSEKDLLEWTEEGFVWWAMECQHSDGASQIIRCQPARFCFVKNNFCHLKIIFVDFIAYVYRVFLEKVFFHKWVHTTKGPSTNEGLRGVGNNWKVTAWRDCTLTMSQAKKWC